MLLSAVLTIVMLSSLNMRIRSMKLSASFFRLVQKKRARVKEVGSGKVKVKSMDEQIRRPLTITSSFFS